MYHLVHPGAARLATLSRASGIGMDGAGAPGSTGLRQVSCQREVVSLGVDARRPRTCRRAPFPLPEPRARSANGFKVLGRFGPGVTGWRCVRVRFMLVACTVKMNTGAKLPKLKRKPIGRSTTMIAPLGCALSVIRKRPQSDEEAFEARPKTEGTGQPASDASN